MSSDTENELWGDDDHAPAPATSSAPASPVHPVSSPKAEMEDAPAVQADDDEAGDLFGDDDADEGGGEAPEREAEPDAEERHRDPDDDDDENRSRDPRERSRSRSTTPARSDRSRTPGSQDSRHRLEYNEEEEVEETSEVWAAVPVPQWPRLAPTDGKVWHLKLPQYVNLEPRPYDPTYYRETLEDDGSELEGVAAKGKMIEVRNTIRWRWETDADGNPVKRGNARMLRWSDGSVSLQLGNEMFDIAPSYGTTLARPKDIKAKDDDSKPQTGEGNETTFLCVAAPSEQVLMTETAIAGQLSLVPTSMDSKTHRELVKHVGQQHVKHSRMKLLDDIGDKKKVEELLARAGGSQQPVAQKARSSRPRPSGSQGGFAGRRAVKRADSDESDAGYGYDSDEKRKKRRRTVGSGTQRRDRDRDAFRNEAGDYDDDDGFVVPDSEDDDEGQSSDDEYSRRKKGKKRSKRREDSEDLDQTELADRRIEEAERAERERKRPKGGDESGGGGGGGSGGGGGAKKRKGKSKEYVTSDEDEDAEGDEDAEAEMEMDVESEEEG